MITKESWNGEEDFSEAFTLTSLRCFDSSVVFYIPNIAGCCSEKWLEKFCLLLYSWKLDWEGPILLSKEGDLLFSAYVYKTETGRGATKNSENMTVQNLQKKIENYGNDDRHCFVKSC